MKQLLCILLCLVLLAQLSACSGPETPETTAAAVGSQSLTERAAPTETEPRSFPVGTTLMVYLMGSDLEAKTAAGSSDLQEIADSGVDLRANQVLVCVGGSPHWHSELGSPEENRILRLTETGYVAEKTGPSRSMGDPSCLADFVNFAAEQAPSEHYALIFWDHGSGPVIGYGKDILFGNDALTLAEMQQAMEQTPFREGRKLDWVGFDACLMASAELACVWAPYADYLAASQEVEPAMGWDYGFLSRLGTCGPETLLPDMAEAYLAACRAYYQQKDFDERDTTLSVMDLSGAEALHEAVEALFAAAGEDVGEAYDQLAAARSETRALGRASTGSEYDLVDLGDLARQMESRYPQQAAALTAAIDRTVAANVNNAEGLCGLSLYYPFFNKAYYTGAWSEVYRGLDVFSSYTGYLQAFEQTWLGSDMLELYAGSVSPSQVSESRFSLQLTPEQAEHYASARYYILKQEGDEAYTKIFSGSTVMKEGDRLVADFDGNILYGVTDYGSYFIPVTVQHDRVGTRTAYTAPVRLTNDTDYFTGEEPEGYVHEAESYCFHLVLDSATGEVEITALLPYQEDSKAELAEGKAEDADLSRWTTYWFNDERHRTLTRYENGAVMPVDEWVASASYTAHDIPIARGIDFLCGPLSYGNYAMVFEIQDTQGNLYCSEPLPIETGTWPELPPPKIASPEPITLQWPAGAEELQILDQDGLRLTAYFDTDWSDDLQIFIKAENKTDMDLRIDGRDPFCNDNISCVDGGFACWAISDPPGAGGPAEDSSKFELGKNCDLGMLQELRSLDFYLYVSNCATREPLIYYQPVRIEFAPGTGLAGSGWLSPDKITEPIGGAYAAEQVLLEDEEFTVRLLRLGKRENDEDLTAVLLYENHTDRMIPLQIDGVALNDVFCPGAGGVYLPAGAISADWFYIDDDYLEKTGIDAITQIRICLRVGEEKMTAWQGYGEVRWLPVRLSRKAAAPSAFKPGEITLYEGHGVRLATSPALQDENHTNLVYMTLENDTDQDISLDATDFIIDGTPVTDDEAGAYFGSFDSTNQAGAGQSSLTALSVYRKDQPKTVSFVLRIMDLTGAKELFRSDERITVTLP